MPRKPELKPASLHFLLNYILGLPVMIGKKTVMAPEIPYQVVRLWTSRTRRQAEIWAEQELRHAGMLRYAPTNTKLAGRRSQPPNELVRWFPGNWRKTA